jgi:hypothetical protein
VCSSDLSHERFLRATFERIDHDAKPPADLMLRWAAAARAPLPAEDACRWLAEALDRPGQPTDTHPTLRARLAALGLAGPDLQQPPQPLAGPSAAQQWLGGRLDALRVDFQAEWARGVQDAWTQQHADAQRLRERLGQLRDLPARDADEELERLQLSRRLEPTLDLRDELAAFNASHPEHALGLFIEGSVRLDHGDAQGLARLESAMALDPGATRPACERAYAYLKARGDAAAADAMAERWRARAAFEEERQRQLETVDPAHALAHHGLDPQTEAAVRARLATAKLRHVRHVYLVRRVLPVDPHARQWLVCVELDGWGRWRKQQSATIRPLASLEWPLPLTFLCLDGPFAPMLARCRAVPGAQLR